MAILQLEKPVEVKNGADMVPICIPSNEEFVDSYVAYGYGCMKNGSSTTQDVLRLKWMGNVEMLEWWTCEWRKETDRDHQCTNIRFTVREKSSDNYIPCNVGYHALVISYFSNDFE
ncbi:unnamed protein product [Toxocara canis]|uniref:Peptidase S1 domain-containing protein n=1 Tax=Toxocara canis TaxID=6265 RepID=A0A183U8G2_TOXCA|nr:unnamed protein product [Toxocara canis]